jgi:hypothetical protein
MQSSPVFAGMDGLSDPGENILTRRANHRHDSILTRTRRPPRVTWDDSANNGHRHGRLNSPPAGRLIWT